MECEKTVENYRLCFLAALCLFLSQVEYVIPKPLPFMRLGLANLPIILSICHLRFKNYLTLVSLKVLLQGIFSGTIFSYIFLFSITGTFASSLIMYGLYKVLREKVSYIGISLSGSLANNFMQICMCYFILFGNNTKLIIPILLTFGSISGILLGIICNIAETHSQWLKEFWNNKLTNDSCGKFVEFGENFTENTQYMGYSCRKAVDNYVDLWKTNKWSVIFITINILLLVSCMFLNNLIFRLAVLILSYMELCFIKKRLVNAFPAMVMILTIVSVNMFDMHGKVLLTLGSFFITQDALLSGLGKALILSVTVNISKLVMEIIKKYKLLTSGSLLGSIILIYGELVSYKINRKDGRNKLLSGIDSHLINVWENVIRN